MNPGIELRRVILDCTSAAKTRGGGIQNYIANLVTALRGLGDGGVDYIVAFRASHFRRRGLLRALAPGGARALLPLRRWGADLLHGLGVRLPAFAPGLRKVVTIHDLGVFDAPELYTDRWVTRRRRRILQTLRRADGVLTYTAHTRDRLRHHAPWYAGPVEVVPLGVDHGLFRPEPDAEDRAAAERFGIDRPFILQVGQLAARKRPELTLRAFAALKTREDLQLVLPGGSKAGFLEGLREEAKRLGVERSLLCPGFVSGDVLPRLYRQCSAFVSASEYEGFGLPVLEAMACGAPVVVSRTSCLPEVVGDGAFVADPADGALAGELERVLEGGEETARLRERAVARARTFTWRRTAEKTVEFYRRVLG